MPVAQVKKVRRFVLYDLSAHPDYARTVGEIAATWTLVEHALFGVFSVLSRAVPQRAQAAYYALVNNKARIDMLRAIAKDKTLMKPARDMVAMLLEQASIGASMRNAYVHKPWLIKDGNVYIAEQMALVYPHGARRRVHLQELIDARDHITLVLKEANAFAEWYSTHFPLMIEAHDVHPTLRKKQQRQRRRPSPTDDPRPQSEHEA